MFKPGQAIFRSLISLAAPLCTGLLVACGGGSITPASGPSQLAPERAAAVPAATLKFVTLNSSKDKTFNQLLGINDAAVISGYYGSGAKGHPNKGYTIVPPYGQKNYTFENYPGSAQTQVVAINNLGYTAGFWIDSKGVQRGFTEVEGVFHSYADPKTGKGTVNQLLGLNDLGQAVGFYTAASGTNFGYMLSTRTHRFTPIKPPGASNVTAAAINDAGDIAGFYGPPSAAFGFFKKGGNYFTLTYPNSTSTIATGINAFDQIVGAYVDSSGNMHGFLLSHPGAHPRWESIDDPNGVGTTTINGIDDHRQMVGFYTDSKGNTDGMLINP